MRAGVFPSPGNEEVDKNDENVEWEDSISAERAQQIRMGRY